MAGETQHADVIRLIQQALPLESTATLLDALANVWSSATSAPTCFVSIFDGRRIEGIVPREGECRTVSRPADHWTSTEATDALGEFEPPDAASVTVVPFELNGDALGGAFLFGIKSLRDYQPLADASARLVAQLCALTRATRKNQCERQLRDLKLEALAEFAAGAGHEINNPVATIVGRTSLLLKNESDSERRRALETIGGQALRIRDMIGDAMTFARPPEPVCESICASEDIDRVVESLREQFARHETSLKLEVDSDIRLQADGEQFRVVVSCLLRNSLEAMRHGGAVTIQLSRKKDKIEVARLTVRDDGPGLDAIEAEHLFDPFFSGRQAGRGLGFGLSRCWRILQMHGGQIDVETVEGKPGLVVHTDWPIALEA